MQGFCVPARMGRFVPKCIGARTLHLHALCPSQMPLGTYENGRCACCRSREVRQNNALGWHRRKKFSAESPLTALGDEVQLYILAFSHTDDFLSSSSTTKTSFLIGYGGGEKRMGRAAYSHFVTGFRADPAATS